MDSFIVLLHSTAGRGDCTLVKFNSLNELAFRIYKIYRVSSKSLIILNKAISTEIKRRLC